MQAFTQNNLSLLYSNTYFRSFQQDESKDNHDHTWDADLFFFLLSEVFEDEWGRVEMNTALVLSRTDAYYFICHYNINDERLFEKIKWSSRLTIKNKEARLRNNSAMNG